MSIRWLWFPAAVAVAVVVGVALGLLTDTDSDSEVQSSASSTSTTVSNDPTSTTTASPTTTVTTDDTAGTTTTTEGNSVPVGFSTQWGWFHTGTSTGELPAMQPIPEQTALVVADFDGDGSDDIIVGGRRGENALQLMRLTPSGWSTAVIEPDELSIEAGGAAHDIDGDGDLDLAMGGDFSSQDVWWWENPGADNIEQRWTRRTIKTNGGPKHHDMVFADIDGDGPAELIFWNQRSETPTLWAATIPADPTSAGQWNRDSIFFGTDASEGLDAGDVDGDGDIDLLAGGNLLVNDGSGGFSATEIAADLVGGRALMAQLVAGDAAELIFDSGEAAGPTVWFQWDGSQWVRNELRSVTNQGHSLDAGDVDGDGDVDILSGEMRLEVGDAARLTVFLNDGAGSFETRDISFGMDNHASSFGDVDGDGDLDIVSKPFNWDTPRLDVWINSEATALANGWQRTVIDPDRPDRAVFLRAGDLDGDGDADLA
ncbi:MAG: VCBS repeat-containing protein, partial [Acidimicrobiales bacterium]|nr:VCBS repeat-containing protein [Acidimicrobiales bacterium]